MSRSGSTYSTPRDANRVPFLTAASTADGVTPVVLEADPVTHALGVSISGTIVTGGLTDTQLRASAVPTIETTGLIPKAYDYLAYTSTNTTTDTYVYKSGGTGGTIVATVTIVYTDSTKSVISTVTRT